MTALRMSADGRAKLMQREGVRTKAYRDSVGVWTIGVGHTAAAGPPHPVAGMEISRAEVDRLLSRDLGQYENAVNGAVRVPLTQGQFDALVSFCFNIGIGGFKGSTVVKLLNKRNYRGAADAFMKWVKPPEIRGRRESERQQFVRATYAQKAEQSGGALTAADLRAAGSRTMDGAAMAKTGATAAVGLEALSGGADYLSKASDAADTASNIAANVQNVHQAAGAASQSATGVLAWLHAHPGVLFGLELAITLGALAAIGYTLYGVSKIIRAKVDDTNDLLAAPIEESFEDAALDAGDYPGADFEEAVEELNYVDARSSDDRKTA
ncbi:lysozyme [Methylocystis sp. SC2]|uniref:lysozyme n=1 Tax=Methylocystis sp. (strain SC2) TaxID=187303 RepID=UPI00027AF0FD|nr:lysozyme [Methylocystis sp. SC2]CCJ07116.1 Phage-related lysozyme (muraminidase) [Methylocystis sp. SC2]